jgi:multicomponent Na+:H+ antiporter subunit D
MHLAMAASAFLCLVIGSYTPFLYNMLPHADVTYHPYNGYHLSETLQILAFTALAFVFLKDKLGAKTSISLDLDWFYRMGGRGFLWLAKNPIQWLDTAWGAAYRVVGLYSLMTTARFWSWFDWHAIDGVVDGSAGCIKAVGRRVTIVLQRGQIQQTIYYSVTFAAILLISYVWL